jgi:hypothetical protein
MKQNMTIFDVESITNRIRRNNISLDADFQRGEVWDNKKKRKLIDTIIRGWPIPPVIFLNNENKYDILDGLQRITAIKEFIIDGTLRVNSRFEPKNNSIVKLHNLTFLQIESRAKDDDFYQAIYDKVLATPIPVYEISDATEKEIAELFQRFNSPMTLTTSEKRNAHIGETRTQISDLNAFFIESGASLGTLGFSNVRKIYEDILLKVCYTIEYQIIDKKITSDMLSSIYRNNSKFKSGTIKKVKDAIELFFKVNCHLLQSNSAIKYSRATIYSVLIFLTAVEIDENRLIEILKFVSQNSKYKGKSLKSIFDEYTMYASTDYPSILIRQAILKILSNNAEDFELIIKKYETETYAQVARFSKNYNFISDEFS